MFQRFKSYCTKWNYKCVLEDKSLDTDISQDPNRFLPMSGPVKEPVQEPVSDKFAKSIGPQKVTIPLESKRELKNPFIINAILTF